MFNKNKEIPVDSAAGNRIGTVFSLGSWHGYGDNKELPSDSTHPYNAVYHAKGISNTPFGRVSLGWHATVESAQAALRNHHEDQKQRYQRAADLHRRDADHHQGIRDSMQDSYVPRSKLAIIKEAIQDNQKTMRDQARGLFHYHDDMVNSPSHLGAEFPHIHETLRKQAAERYRNLAGGTGTLTSRHTKEVYPKPEFKTESTAPKRTYKDEEDRLNAWADRLDGMSAPQAVARFPDVKNPQHAIRAHRNQIESLRNQAWEARRKHLAGYKIESYVSERAIRFRVVAKNHSLDGTDHDDAESAREMAKKIRRTGGKAHVIELGTGRKIAESKKEDEEASAEIKPWHWTGAKTALANKYPGTFNPKMSTRHPKFPNVIKVNGKSLSLKRMIAYVAGKMAERDAAKAKK